MRKTGFLGALVVAVALIIAGALPARAASVVATIDISAQTMYVSIRGEPTYAWPVSTGRKGYRTPAGYYRPTRMHREYYSRKYHGSPMPYSIFFRGGYAIHGTYQTKQLGRPASHGCVRLHPDNARRLFNLVMRHGAKNTRIVVRR